MGFSRQEYWSGLLFPSPVRYTPVQNKSLLKKKKKKKHDIELQYDPAIPFLGMYQEKMKTLVQKDMCTPMFIAALFTVAKIYKQP